MTMSFEAEVHQMCLQIQEKFSSHSSDNSKWNLLKEFLKALSLQEFSKFSCDYYSVSTTLLDSLRPTIFSEKWHEEVFDDFFLKGIHYEAFLSLVRKFGESSESYQQKKILNILQKFLRGPSLENLLLYQCSSCGTVDPTYVFVSNIWSDLITYIISLPERIANKAKGRNISKIFRSNYYTPLLVSTIVKVMTILHDRIANSKNCTLEFLGILLGRLCIAGNADIIAKKLCVEFIKRSESDFIWRKITQNLVSKMPISSLESFITNLLLVIPWYGYVDWILGDATLKIQKLNFLMTVKLVLFRNFKQKIVLQNIIGHFACSESRQDQFWKIFESLLKNWTNSSNVKHQSHDQQVYIAAGLMVCSGWLKLINDTAKTKAYLTDVLEGTNVRIGNSSLLIRTIGMVVASNLIPVINPKADQLDVQEIGDEKTVEYLQSFTNIPQSPSKDTIFFEEDLKCFAEVEVAQKKWTSQQLQKTETKTPDSNCQDESDDDLEPYEMDNDASLKKPKHPLYLNDCLQGLIEQEKGEWLEQCLIHAENLIINNSDTVQEVAEEMAKVVLHLDNTFNIENFDTLRMQILVSLMVKCPLSVVKYLSTEFYKPNYSIRQRLDILEVINRSCTQLSLGNVEKAIEVQEQKTKASLISKEPWKLIVEQRIATKTRYITKIRSKPPELQESMFAPIAGFFLFPLVQNYYKHSKALKVFGEDGYVLSRLIYTLGIVMHASSSSPYCAQMGEAFLEFLCAVWNHEESIVREAVLFSLVTIYTSIPGYLISAPDSSLQLEIYKSEKWLQNVIASDLDVNCQVKASFALNLIINIMKEELPSIPGLK